MPKKLCRFSHIRRIVITIQNMTFKRKKFFLANSPFNTCSNSSSQSSRENVLFSGSLVGLISGRGWLITEHVGRIVAYSMQCRQVMDHAGVDGFKGYLILCRFSTFL